MKKWQQQKNDPQKNKQQLTVSFLAFVFFLFEKKQTKKHKKARTYYSLKKKAIACFFVCF